MIEIFSWFDQGKKFQKRKQLLNVEENLSNLNLSSLKEIYLGCYSVPPFFTRGTTVKALVQVPTHFSIFLNGDFVVTTARTTVNTHEPFSLLQKLSHVKTQRSSYNLTCFGTVDARSCLL